MLSVYLRNRNARVYDNDELLVRLYGMKPYYNFKSKEPAEADLLAAESLRDNGGLALASYPAFDLAALALWTWIGWQAGLGTWAMAGVAVAAAQVAWHFVLIRQRTREGCFRAFRINHWVGFSVFVGVVIDLALG